MFGIFLKETDKDIGLKGKRQMPLFAKMNNPLIVENREALVYKAISAFNKGYKTRCGGFVYTKSLTGITKKSRQNLL